MRSSNIIGTIRSLPLFSIKNASLIVGFGILTALSSKLSFYLPFSPVPITLQSFVVLLSGAILGARSGALSQITLIAMGAAGLPVFAQALPGNLVLLGPTGGYVLGFVLAAYISGAFFEKFTRPGFLKSFLLFFVASLFIFLPGVAWLTTYTGKDLWTAIQIGFVPFILGDFVKCAFAVGFLRLLRWARY